MITKKSLLEAWHKNIFPSPIEKIRVSDIEYFLANLPDDRTLKDDEPETSGCKYADDKWDKHCLGGGGSGPVKINVGLNSPGFIPGGGGGGMSPIYYERMKREAMYGSEGATEKEKSRQEAFKEAIEIVKKLEDKEFADVGVPYQKSASRYYSSALEAAAKGEK